MMMMMMIILLVNTEISCQTSKTDFLFYNINMGGNMKLKLIGNENTFTQLKLAIKSSIVDQRSIPHTLLTGAAGCGKTSTAKFLSQSMGSDLITIASESIKTRDDVLALSERLNRKGFNPDGNKVSEISPSIVFIDEIHRLPVTGQEYLGIMMEEYVIPVNEKNVKIDPYGKFGFGKKEKKRWCPWFTLIGATTNDGLLTKPFRDRFKLRFVFSAYNIKESQEIVKAHADRLNVSITDKATLEISKRGRGVPRILVSYLERCKDCVTLAKSKFIDDTITSFVFGLMKIDENGLTQSDIHLLKFLYECKDPIGLDNLATVLNESPVVIKETMEPFLIQKGLMIRKSKGRVITEKGEEYLVRNKHLPISKESYVDIPIDYERSM
jgi:holliday junction DNA helicase RuvB